MNEEIQAAYNEWLLKYGFRWVDMSVIKTDRPLFWCALPAGVMERYVEYSIRKYKLKDIKNENPTKAP